MQKQKNNLRKHLRSQLKLVAEKENEKCYKNLGTVLYLVVTVLKQKNTSRKHLRSLLEVVKQMEKEHAINAWQLR